MEDHSENGFDQGYSAPVSEGWFLNVSSYLRKHKFLITVISIPVLLFAGFRVLLLITPFISETFVYFKPDIKLEGFKTENVRDTARFIAQQENRIRRLEGTLKGYSTNQPYFVVNTTENTFRLFNNGKLVREGHCSTGSYILLDAGDERKWMFETPKGMFRIQGKIESPVWRKPDWAFVEEGLPVPAATSNLRYERGVLGDYALSIGNGYLIHGTLYKRLLGMPVTHGCVRMDDADLEAVFHTLQLGSKVLIY